MHARRRSSVLLALAAALAASSAVAQSGSAPSSGLSDAVQVDEVSSAARTLLARAKAHVAERQWDEAIETLRQVMEHDGGKLIRLEPQHFITLREYCQIRLAALPPEGLALYRSRVDSLAKQWYDRGIAERDAALLGRVVDQLFVSSWGDAALMALGEIALERADYRQARWCWERISPELRAADGQPLWLSLRLNRSTDAKQPRAAVQHSPAKDSDSPRWLAYPDTKLNLADVRARLVLVSIMEGHGERARVELDDFGRRHPDAKGRLAGREGPYGDTLGKMLTIAETRPATAPPRDWTTFAGSPERAAIAAEPKSLGNKLWEIPLGDGAPFRANVDAAHYVSVDKLHWPLPALRPAEDQQALLSIYPVVVGNLVLYSTEDKVFAFDLATGKPAWPVASRAGADESRREPGEIYSASKDRDNGISQSAGGASFPAFGAPRFTLTVNGNRLYARLGSPITGRPSEGRSNGGTNYLICLDLAAEGLLLWRTPSDNAQDERWSYEGAPLAAGNDVYVVMRYSDVRPQVHVACLDARTGALRWRKLIGINETVVGGQWPEITSNLLTLAGETLYVNTNLGAVAALSAADGEIRWISGYPRAKTSEDNAAHFYRDLTPAVYYRGSLFVAPSDSPDIFALDASTGALLWESHHLGLEQNMHLLGVGGDNLIASGRQLWWINVDSGGTTNYWYDKTASGYGRGALVGDQVYWPMRTQIRRFKQRVSEIWSRENSYFDADEPIRLDHFDPPLGGGNLVVANGCLLIATPTKLIAFGPGKPTSPPDERILTQAAQPAGATKHRD